MAAAGPSLAALSGCGPSGERETTPHRYIDQKVCIGCGECLLLCPVGAIVLDETSSIDPDECCECGVCSRSRVCPVDAIRLGNLKWPRILREVFSNPLAEHEATGVPGRGTPGIKTNDSENRYRKDQIGVFVEMGRPVLGARLHDVEKAVQLFTVNGYAPVKENPVYYLIRDHGTGSLMTEILKERVISCVLEFVVPRGESEKLLGILQELGNRVDTVFNASVALRADDQGESPFNRIFPPDTFCLPQTKVNIGMAADIPAGRDG
jgi:ferredoxin